ncbi:MAG: hypothetical protein AAGI23_15115 [Bacteroidota bacterium]
MIIANPIYDVVFKRLMENERVAKFFIGTMLDQEVESVDLKPKEFTYSDKLTGIAVFRLDFMAVIKTEDGRRQKILIEIQKAKNPIDLMRFRNYLAEQYKKEDKVDGEKQILPITTIYILGFKIPEIETACIRVERQYVDLVGGKLLEKRSDFVEKLTHDSYVIQVNRITDRYKSRLDKLLSVFEQSNFIDESKVTKEYKHDTDEEDVKLMTNILHHTGTDPETREEIEKEVEAWRTMNAMFEEKEKQYLKALSEKDQALSEKDGLIDEQGKALSEKDQALSEKDQALNKKDQALSEKDKLIEELRRQLKEREE